MSGIAGEGVLVVEDEYLIAIATEAQLEELGFDPILLAPSLVSARRYLDSQPICLAILDVNVGSERVFPLAAELAGAGIPLIFSTAWMKQEFPPEWASYPILTKPWGRPALEQAVKLVGREPVRASRGTDTNIDFRPLRPAIAEALSTRH